MDSGLELLSQLVFNRTYSKTLENGMKETWDECVTRRMEMDLKNFPDFAETIEDAFEFVYDKKVVPSMRSLQFAGAPIERENARQYNCCFTTIKTFRDFADISYLLSCGTGVGFSVQRRHINSLPIILKGHVEGFRIGDSKESWADSFLTLLKNPMVAFDYSMIRAAGAQLSTGGQASGPGVLMQAHENIREILVSAYGRKLRPINVHDIVCIIADCIVAGGVRRSACISLFDADDKEMLHCKHGQFPFWRYRSNNSAVLHRFDKDFEKKLQAINAACFESQVGEPGLFLTNDYDVGTNPCCEISLRDKQMCNLTEVIAPNCESAYDFKRACIAATTIGTFQSTYTNFRYIQPQWKQNTEDDRLLGVSITGMAECWDMVQEALNTGLAQQLQSENARLAGLLDINPAARIGCVKPSGTTSALMGCSSGIHAVHSEYYLRRIKVGYSDPIASALITQYGLNPGNSGNFIEEDVEAGKGIVVTIPVHKPDALYRGVETSIELLERTKFIFERWIKPSHRYGINTHNVSLTVNYKPGEEQQITEWMLDNRDSYAGISLFPFSDPLFDQLPFEAVTKEQFNAFTLKVPSEININGLDYTGSVDERLGELACSNGQCELK